MELHTFDLRHIARLLLLSTCVALAACGGGDDETVEAPNAHLEPVNCAQTPAACR